jgi:hypothetical protein
MSVGRALAAAALGVMLLASCASSPSITVPPADPGSYLHVVAVAPGDATYAPSGNRWTIYLDGFIDAGAVGRLAGVIDREKIANATVYFNSPGGHLVTAMAVGRLLRARRFATNVGAQTDHVEQPGAGACYSACPFAYAGGVRRSLAAGSEIGVHRAENNVPIPDASAFQQVVSQQVSGYLMEMGISKEFLAIMSQVPHDSIRVLTLAEAERLHLVNEARAAP